MIVGLVGYLFEAVARVRPDERSADLGHVGEELVRLEHRRRQRATTSR